MTAGIGVAAIAAVALGACGADDGTPSGSIHGRAPEQVVDTIGDTIVVRNLAGSVWGAEATLVPEVSIGELDGPEEYLFGNVYAIAVDDDRRVYVLDFQAKQVRVFDSEGHHLRTLGGRGEGPGELGSAVSVAALSDGRVLIQDHSGYHVEVYGPDGSYLEQWQYGAAGVIYPQKPLSVDQDGRIHVAAAASSKARFAFYQVVVLGSDGTRLDTLDPPGNDFQPPSVKIPFPTPIAGHTSAPYPVPLTARRYWTVHPNGHFLTGISTDYRIDLQHGNGVLRIERAYEPAPISESERSHYSDDLTSSIRRTQSDWSWNGPPVPETKPPFRGLIAGRDGRIWVWLWTEAHEVENADHDPDDPGSRATTWRSPLRYDAFRADGAYLGVLVVPDDVAYQPDPVFNGDHVWAVTRDELGVQRVVRYRIVVGGT